MVTNADSLPNAPSIFEEFPDLDQRSCRLLGPTALVVQALMGVLAVLSLVYKRQREKPKRPWRIWLFDVSKQIVGQMFVHGLNVLISDVGAHHKSSNACVFYFLNVLIDTTLGVAIIYIILHVVTYILTEKLLVKGFESGKYGSPPSTAYWARQAAVYVLALTSMKLIVIALLAFVPLLFELGKWLLSWTQIGDSDAFQVIFTMGIFPIIMNILQFWLIDSIVKASGVSFSLPADSPRNSTDDCDREPLFRAPSDDSGDDAGDHPRREIGVPSQSDFLPQYDHPNGASPSHDPNSAGATIPISPPSHTEYMTSAHEYPPSMPSSVPSTFSESIRTSPSVHKPKRSPPPPIPIRSWKQPTIDDPSHTHQAHTSRAAELRKGDAIEDSSQEWLSSWDSNEWAEKVVEEPWIVQETPELNPLTIRVGA